MIVESARFCGDPFVADDSKTCASRESVEKSNFLRTEAETEAVFEATIEPRVGEETGPRDGFLLAGDCKNVLIGDLERGGGIRILCRWLRIAVGSGIVPNET